MYMQVFYPFLGNSCNLQHSWALVLSPAYGALAGESIATGRVSGFPGHSSPRLQFPHTSHPSQIGSGRSAPTPRLRGTSPGDTLPPAPPGTHNQPYSSSCLCNSSHIPCRQVHTYTYTCTCVLHVTLITCLHACTCIPKGWVLLNYTYV